MGTPILYGISLFPLFLSLIFNVWKNNKLGELIIITYSIIYIMNIYNLKHLDNIRRLSITTLTIYAIGELWEIPIHLATPENLLIYGHWIPTAFKMFSIVLLYLYTKITPFKFIGYRKLIPYILLIIITSTMLFINPILITGSAFGIIQRLSLTLLFLKINKGFN